MKICHINSTYPSGGAGRIAIDLHEGFLERGCDSTLVFADKGIREDAVEIGRESKWKWMDQTCGSWIPDLVRNKMIRKSIKFFGSTGTEIDQWASRWKEPVKRAHYLLGIENFEYQGIWNWIDSWKETPDIVHLHDLFSDFFDLRALEVLSKKTNVVMTVHNEWPFTGLCHYTLGCERWRDSCGECPHLDEFKKFSNPKADRTSFNLHRKREIYRNSRLHVATPSRWMMARASQSVMMPGIKEIKTIPNGIDRTIFKPGNRDEARKELGLPLDQKIVLFIGNRVTSNQWRVWPWMIESMKLAAQKMNESITFLLVGELEKTETFGGVTAEFRTFCAESEKLAKYYHAADLYLQLSRADNFPTTVLEAMSCGIPVISTKVGGIPEQVDQDETGYLVVPGNTDQTSDAIVRLLADLGLREKFSKNAVLKCENNYSKRQMIDEYLNWYKEILSDSGK